MIVVTMPGVIYTHGTFNPNRQDRNPSITLTMGFKEYNNRYFSGIVDAEYTMGAVYINILNTKGIACLTSRKRIAMAESHIPVPDEIKNICNMNRGSKSKFQDGEIR